MHNNIMAAGLRDRSPMFATGRYAQWQSRFLRYIDTRPNGDSLRKCILEGPYKPSTVTIPEKEAIYFLLTDIGDEIYSTVDACQTAHGMWIAIERVQHETMESHYSIFYKMINEMIRNNLTVAMIQVNVQFLQQLQPEWSRFVTIVKQNHDLDTVSYHKLFDVLKQYHELFNQLALVDAAQRYPDPYYQAIKSHKSYAPPSKESSFTISNAPARYKGKEIAKPITPRFESASKEDKDSDVVGARVTVGSQVVQQTGIQCFNCKEFGHFIKECMKPKKVKDYSYHKKKMLLCKQAGKRIESTLQLYGKIQEVPTADSSTDTEPLEQVQYDDEYNVFANERQHYEQPESISNTCVVEKVDSNVIPDSSNMRDNDIQTDQNAKDECAALANLIANLTLDTEENKKILKQSKKANASWTQELKECKSNLE
nr:hypothetical protein [Tanacetum cinerariifolium]